MTNLPCDLCGMPATDFYESTDDDKVMCFCRFHHDAVNAPMSWKLPELKIKIRYSMKIDKETAIVLSVMKQ